MNTDSMTTTESKCELFTVASVETGKDQKEQSVPMGFFERYVQPCLAELVGSALFIFVGCSSVIGNAGLLSSVQPALAHGLALAIAIALFGEISGGHFNPAVSACVYLVGGMELVLLGPYVIAQMFGGMIGAGLAKAIYPAAEFSNASGAAFTSVSSSSDIGAVTVAEMVMTLFLTMAVSMGALNDKTRSTFAPFLIGLTVTANILAGGKISGACMNPARAFGPAAVANYWDYHWVYWIGPLAGALLTVIIVRLLIGDKKTRIVLK